MVRAPPLTVPTASLVGQAAAARRTICIIGDGIPPGLTDVRLWREGELGRVFTAVDDQGRPCTLRTIDGFAPPVPPLPFVEEVRASGDGWVVYAGVPEETLADRLQRDGPMAVEDADRMGQEMRLALEALHRAGIVHGGVCPSTIVWTGDRWQLTAVGLAPLLCDYTTVSAVTAYALLDGGEPSPEGDEFSLGLVLHEAVHGIPAVPWYDGEPAAALLRRREEYSAGPPPRPKPPSPTPVADEDVQFTVYRPGRVQPARWYTMVAFAHKTDEIDDPVAGRIDPVEQVRQQAAALLGPQLASFMTTSADSDMALPRGSDLVFVPHVEGIEFNPRQRSFVWEEPVHCETFRLRAADHLAGTRARGGLSVFLGAVIIAEVSLSIAVDAAAAEDGQEPAEAERARRYDRVFVSYSHDDHAVVERVGAGIRTLGHEVVLDRTHLRSGQDWSAELERLIHGANVFQLFWSRNSMQSEYVRREWTYALSLARPGFVRPVYWEDPFPEAPGLPPDDLRRIHFVRFVEPEPERRPGGARRQVDQVEGRPSAPRAESARVEAPRVERPPPPPPPAPGPPPQASPPTPGPGHSHRRRPRAAVIGIGTAFAAVLATLVVGAGSLGDGERDDPVTTLPTVVTEPDTRIRVGALTTEPTEVCRLQGTANVRVTITGAGAVSSVRLTSVPPTARTAIHMEPEPASAASATRTYAAPIGPFPRAGRVMLTVEVLRDDTVVARRTGTLTVVDCVR